ncbi:MAG: n-type ATP pyrophosphatase superfamily protein [Parcubacteria group bacterium Gr01-1014_38]|nr:MAG: n-type ATP pyrophosphatase superfamily protein [Parcubacteria group bacterium Gr01-1014_38]
MASQMVSVVLTDRLDRKHSLHAEAGQSVESFLFSHHIPLDAVIVRRNGKIVNEHVRMEGGDEFVFEMVRAYLLPDFLRELGAWTSADKQHAESADPHSYTKRVLWFDASGYADLAEEQIPFQEFPEFLERYFVQSVQERQLIKEGSNIGLALSGGRDSLSLLYLLARTRNQLPSFTLRGITVCGLSKLPDLDVASTASENLGVPHEFVRSEGVAGLFGLRGTVEEALEAILRKFGRAKTINCVHAIMRTAVERYYADHAIRTVAFGLHNEDLLASLIRSLVNGIPFGESFYRKSWGPFELIYPLWAITKKELTLYLEVVAPPSHSSQGSPTAYDRGGPNRDVQYLVADSLQTLWPGFSYHAFEGYQKLFTRAAVAVQHQACRNCQGVYVAQRIDNQQDKNDLCHLCEMLDAVGELAKGI